MKIKEAYISQFKKWQQKKFIFSDHWTHITGENGAGKTTLYEFLFSILFGFKYLESSEYLQSDAGGYLIIEKEGIQYQVERYLHQHRGRATVIQLPERSIIGYEEVLQELLGVKVQEAKNIYMFDAMNVAQQKIHEADWQAYILSYAFSGSDQLFALEKKYQKEQKGYYKIRSQAGKIQQLQQEIQYLQRKIEEVEVKQPPIWLEQQALQVQQELRQLEREYSCAMRAEELTKVVQETELYLPYEETLIQVLQQLDTEESIPDHIDEKTFQQLVSHYQKMKQQRQKYQKIQKRYQQFAKLYSQWKEAQQTKIKKQKVFLFSGIFVTLIGFFLLLYRPTIWKGFFWIAWLICFIVLVLKQDNKIPNNQAFIQKASQLAGQNITDLSMADTYLVSLQKQRIACIDFSPFYPHLSLEGLSFKEKIIHIHQFLVEQKHWIELEKQKQQQTEIQNVDKIMAAVPNFSFENNEQTTVFCKSVLKQISEYSRHATELWKVSEQIPADFSKREWEQKIENKKTEYREWMTQKEEQTSGKEMKLWYQEKSQKEAELYQELKSYQMLSLKLNWVRDMKEELEGNQLQLLLQKASYYLSKLIGKNIQVQFKDQKLVWKEKNQIYQLGQLSLGTKSQVITALRFAFILSQKEIEFPIFLDEAWAFYDEKRKERYFLLLQKISETRQIFTFAHEPLEMENIKMIQLEEE